MNISGIVVKTTPNFLQEVLDSLRQSGICDVHFHDESGRIIVTIEGEGIGEETAKLKKLQEIPHVVAADMVYSYSEEELEAARKEFEMVDVVPEVLKREDLKAEEITYGGDLRKKDI